MYTAGWNSHGRMPAGRVSRRLQQPDVRSSLAAVLDTAAGECVRLPLPRTKNRRHRRCIDTVAFIIVVVIITLGRLKQPRSSLTG